MAIQTRYAGDAQGVNNVDAKTDGTLATIVATGLTKNPLALKITGFGTFVAGESATGGAVETILRSIAIDSTIVMYQVDATQISVLVEATGSNAATIQTRLQAANGGTTGNIGVAGNIWAGGGVAVSSSNGFKLA
jgi:hypothetical protein